MIGFRDEEPTYAEAAEAVAEHLAVLDGLGRCMACQNDAEECDRYHPWCLGRTARVTASNNVAWRRQFLEQLELVVSMNGYFPKETE